jgi:hypothetical protein
LGGATSAKNIEQRPPIEQRRSGNCKDITTTQRGAGTTTQFAAPQNDINWRSPDQITPKMQKAMAEHETAAHYKELQAPMEAELKIHGDTSFVHQSRWADAVVSIIVINPFQIFSGGSYHEWLAGPMCNPIFSDKEWMIKGVNHQISDGAYTTTLKVQCMNVNKTEQ